MTANGWRVNVGAGIALALGLAVAAIVLLPAGGTARPGRTAPSRRAGAIAEARRLLARLPLPASASASAPTTTPGTPVQEAELAGLGRPVADDVVQRSMTSTVSASVAAVRAYLLAHPPRGARPASGALTFTPRRLPPTISAASLRVTLLAAGADVTVVHAEADVHWRVARPVSERVPVSALRIEITRGRLGGRPGLALTVTNPQAARIDALINRLAIVQPGGVYRCPTPVVGLDKVTFSFRARSEGPVLAQASEGADVVSPTTACDAMRFTVDGRAETPLLGGAQLLREVSAIVGYRLWVPPYAA